MPSRHDVVSSLYSLADRSGLLDRPLFQRLFVSAYFLYKRAMEDSFTPLVQHRPDLFAGGHILDVGANIGYTATLFATVVSQGYNVFAFEPEPKNFESLRESISARQVSDRVKPVHAAVGDRDGTAELWLNPTHPADHRMVTSTFHGDPGLPQVTRTVPILRLDEFCAREIPGQPVSFIKIDVQGYEECVCRGMSDTLLKNPGALIGLEYSPKDFNSLGFDALKVPLFFRTRGYAAYSLKRRKGPKPIPYDAIADLVGPKGYIDLLFSKTDKIRSGFNR